MKEQGAKAPMGPLVVHPDNPRYFADGAGNAVYLTGSHTWANLQERGYEGETPDFDYDAYLDFLAGFGHNFIRLWAWEHAHWMQFTDRPVRYKPSPYRRTGPAAALDGKPKFDLTLFNQEYFDRLRHRVTAARDRGIYVAVMLFQGFSIEQKGAESFDTGKNPWDGHPFNRANNVNGIDGDLDGDGLGREVHMLAIPEITALQEAYLRKVIDTVGDLDNILYEIANESGAYSTDWQYHTINFVKQCESETPKQHLVGMTYQYEGGTNAALFDSPADWISPNGDGGYRHYPPAADGSKVIISDTDHLWGVGGDRHWAWKTFLRGMHPIYMDPYKDVRDWEADESVLLSVRKNLGYTRAYAERTNLAKMTPRQDLSSSGYCLANPAPKDAEYLVYLPDGGSVTVDLTAAAGKLSVEWFDPASGASREGRAVQGGSKAAFTSPLEGQDDAVLYISAKTLQGR